MANTMDKLLPCPFCGKAPRSRWYGADVPGAEDGGYWGVDCCMAHSHADSEAEAVAAWNRRATSEAQVDAGAVDAKAWLLDVMGTWDFTMPTEAFNKIVNRLAASATPRTEPAEGQEACPRDCGCVVHCRREQLQALATPTAGDAKAEGREADARKRGGRELLEEALTVPRDWRPCSVCTGFRLRGECEHCGGSGWRRKCGRLDCIERGCDGGRYCYISKDEVAAAMHVQRPSTTTPAGDGARVTVQAHEPTMFGPNDAWDPADAARVTDWIVGDGLGGIKAEAHFLTTHDDDRVKRAGTRLLERADKIITALAAREGGAS